MKLFKSLLMLGLVSIFAVNTAQGAETKKTNQTQKKDIRLERFNQNVGIHFVERGLQLDENNQEVVTLTYVIENRGKNKIKSVNWISIYQVNNEDIFSSDFPVNFDPSLASGQKINVTVTIPVAQMPQRAQQFFTSREAKIAAVNGAKNLKFTNKKQIVVSR